MAYRVIACAMADSILDATLAYTTPDAGEGCLSQSVAPLTTASLRSPVVTAAWSIIAAFGVYFCMYAFRKPFTAAAYADASIWGIGEKTCLVVAQVLGYMASKIVGIRVIAEMPAHRRAIGLLVLIGTAEGALFLFGLAPRPFDIACLFINGLSLGMVYGLVLGYLEGKRNTEALTAGLCSSFILADGVTKALGTALLNQGISERWMPAVAGMIAAPPLLLFIWMLSTIAPPDAADVEQRSERVPMTREDRLAMLRRYGGGLAALIVVYLLMTIARSIRADFAPEIWRALGSPAAPETFVRTELLVALGVIVVNGLSVWIVDNRRAFFTSLAVSLMGVALIAATLVGWQVELLSPFAFMTLIGLGLYLPYVAMHTTVFERLIAMMRERGNLGFLMYVADSVGYLGYVGVVLAHGVLAQQQDFLWFFKIASGAVAGLSALSLVVAWTYFARRTSAAEGEVSVT